MNPGDYFDLQTPDDIRIKGHRLGGEMAVINGWDEVPKSRLRTRRAQLIRRHSAALCCSSSPIQTNHLSGGTPYGRNFSSPPSSSLK